ncbi:zinc ribbon domain-containing protein [Virgibacillus byunsanensis]|uniref:Zinc ribbon domain-containing protein n=1 Tax=Virgibacillus byunsanensis TaxID=570945 RepID=A0ABW3LSE6_9BACI
MSNSRGLHYSKTKLLVDIGQEIYQSYREGNDVTASIQEKAIKIKELDAAIYENEAREKGQNESHEHTCSCGAPLTDEDIFCQECGKKAELPVEEYVEMVTCHSCDRHVPAKATFCNICGFKL